MDKINVHEAQSQAQHQSASHGVRATHNAGTMAGSRCIELAVAPCVGGGRGSNENSKGPPGSRYGVHHINIEFLGIYKNSLCYVGLWVLVEYINTKSKRNTSILLLRTPSSPARAARWFLAQSQYTFPPTSQGAIKVLVGYRSRHSIPDPSWPIAK